MYGWCPVCLATFKGCLLGKSILGELFDDWWITG